MPPKNSRQCLDRVLGSLAGEDFDRFVNELVHRQQEPRVLLNRVEGKKHWQVTEVMVATFTASGAVDVAVELLEEISLTSNAEELAALAKACGYKAKPGPGAAAADAPAGAGGPPPAAAAAPRSEKHFVDRHRRSLIQDLKLVEPILDVLLDHDVINKEMYDEVREEKPASSKMRKLFEYLHGTGDAGKDVFLAALKEQQPYLYKKLLNQSD